MKQPIAERVKDRLSNVDDFVDFMGLIYEARESLIAELEDASTDRIQQISGKVAMCDKVLQWGNWRAIQSRYQPD